MAAIKFSTLFSGAYTPAMARGNIDFSLGVGSTILNHTGGPGFVASVLLAITTVVSAGGSLNLNVTVDGTAALSLSLPGGLPTYFAKLGSPSFNAVGSVFEIPLNIPFASSLSVTTTGTPTGTGVYDIGVMYATKI